MKIQQIVSQYRRDFTAIYECEHCFNTYTSSGYDDVYFHGSVIPNMKCPACGQTADISYKPLSTTYPEGVTV
jgi:rubrerythrin